MPISATDAIYEWTTALDPMELMSFTFSWANELSATGASIASDSWALSSAASAAGVEIDQQTNDTNTSTVWLKVNGANQSDAGFDAPTGTAFTIKITMTDTAGRTYERTVKFTVVQQ